MKLLLVEDDDLVSAAYRRVIAAELGTRPPNSRAEELRTDPRVDVVIAETSGLAQAALAVQSFDVVIVDLRIPGTSGAEMGGLEVIAAASQQDPSRPIIVISGYGTIDLVRRTLTQGVFDFIEKSPKAADALVAAVRKAVELRDERVLRSGNPFSTMAGVEPAIFGGRSRELTLFAQTVVRAVERGVSEHFLVLGEWGIGKSALMKEFRRACHVRGLLAVTVPMERLAPSGRPIDAAHSMIEGIVRELPYKLDRFKRFLSYLSSIGVSVLGTGITLGRDTQQKGTSVQAFLHDSLLNLSQDIQREFKHLVILLDDVDNFSEVPEVIATLKQTLSMDSIVRARVLVGMSCQTAFWQQLTATDGYESLSRYFLSRFEVGRLGDPEVKETIARSLAKTGISFDADVVDLVCRHVAGHPFEMQVLCHHLFNNQMSRRVQLEAWESALARALRDLGIGVYNRMLGAVGHEGLRILRVIAQMDTAATAAGIADRCYVDPQNADLGMVKEHLSLLARRNLVICDSHGRYATADPMLKEYVCRSLDSPASG